MMSSQTYIPYTELPSYLNIQPGEILLVASDIARLAMKAIRTEGAFSPDRLIDSFLEILGPGGTLIIPSFNFNLGSGDTFDILKSIPITGALAEAALKRKDFVRTGHPLHSFLVSGKYAGLLAGMANKSSFGEDSPFAFFRKNNVRMLMIGTDVTEAFTFVHHVEELLKVKYRRFRSVRVNYVDEDGNKKLREFMIFAKKPGWTMDLARLEEMYKREGFLTERSVNGIECSSIRLAEAFPIIKDDIFFNRARNISRFSLKLYFREIVKNTLSTLHLYHTLTDRISHAPGPR